MQLPDVSGNPILTWITFVGALLILAGIVADKGLSRISDWWYDLAARRREAEHARDDADIRELRRIADNLEKSNARLAERIAGLEQREDAHTQVLAVHAAWDFKAQQELLRASVDMPAPPPLRPYLD